MGEFEGVRRGRRGSSLLGFVIVLLVVAAVVAGGAYYVVRSLLAPAWIRANVIPTLEAHYGRRILFEDFHIRPRGFILDGVRVFEDPVFDVDGQPFLTVDHVVVRLDPLGLLRRTFLVDFVRLVHPEIHLYQDAQHRWNTASLLAAGSQPPPRLTGSASQIASRFRLVITRVELDDATVRVRRAAPPDATKPKEMSAESLDATVMFHPATGFLDYEAHGKIALPTHAPAALTVFGVLDLGGPRVELQIATENLDADALRAVWTDPNATGAAPALDELVQADVDHSILFVAKNLHAAGIDVSALRLELEASRRAIELRKLDVALLGGTLHADGHADLASTPPTVDMTAEVATLDVAALASAFGRKSLGEALPGQVSGTVFIAGPWAAEQPLHPVLSLDLALERFDGPVLMAALEQAKKSGGEETTPIDIKSSTVDLRATAKTAVLGAVTLGTATVHAKLGGGEINVVDLTGRAFGGHLTATGRLGLGDKSLPWRAQLSLEKARFEDFIPDDPHFDWARTTGTVDVELEGAAHGLTLAAVRSALDGGDGSSAEQAFVKGNARIAVQALDLDLVGHPPRERDEYGPFAFGNVSIDIHVNAERVRLWHLDYAGAVADAHLEDDHITVERIVGAISDGELELSGDVDLARKGLAYHGQGSFKQVETSTFVDAYLPPDVGHMSGLGSAAFEFSLAGTKKNSALDSLALDGYVALHSGQIRDSRLFQHIAKSTGVDEFKELKLTRCGGDIHIASRRVSTDRLVLGGTDARVLLVGGVGFDATLNAQVWLGFSPDTQRNIFSRGILLPYVTDDKGWTYVPVITTGTVKNPDIKIAEAAIRTTAIRAIPDATERIVRESSKLVPGGETIVGGGIDAVKYILGGLGRVLQANSARAKGQVPLDEPVLPTPPSTSPPPSSTAPPD